MRELRVEAVAAAGYVAIAASMALGLESSRPFPVVMAGLLAAAFALASRIRVYVGAAYLIPTQLVLVPMLFVLPAQMVPAVAGGAWLLRALVEILRGAVHAERALVTVADCWHVIGGAVVVVLAGQPDPGFGALGVALAALVGQTAMDAVVEYAREWPGSASAHRVVAGLAGIVFLVDLALTPAGMAAATVGAGDPLGILAVSGVLVLLGAAAGERGRRIDQAVARLHALQEERARLDRALRLHERLRRQANEDELTGLANHRRFQERLAEELVRATRSGEPLSLVLLDVDDFKAVNDRHGHQQGDAVLRAVGAAVRTTCRRTDLPARYGGEELAVLLPATDGDGGYELAEKLRSAVAGVHLLPRGPGLPVTVSAGLATTGPGRDTPGALIAAADAALYEAKRTGKNRTVRPHPADRRPHTEVRSAS